MIKKLPEIQIHSCAKINEKLNEVIDWINDVSALRVTNKQVTANLPNIDAGELAFLSKGNSDLKDELDRTRKALDVAKYAIKNIKNDMKKVKDGDDIWEIQKNLHDYCKTTIKKITTLEQKDVK